MKKKRNAGRLRRGKDDGMLTWLVVLFQFSAMLLLAFRKETVDRQALYLSVIMPAVTVLTLKGLPKIWRVDRTILSMVMMLCSVSVVTLSAIARAAITPLTQAIYIGVGLVVMMIAIAFIRWIKNWKSWNWFMILASFGLLAAPLVIGSVVNGAKNWIIFKAGGVTIFSLQPSEFVKVSLIFILASMLPGKRTLRETFFPLLVSAGLCGVLLLQKDLGALLLYFLTTVFMYFVATSNAFISLSGLGMGAVAAVVAYKALPYVQKRIAIWQNPWNDPLDSGYQLVQALIAIGSGGLFGMGLGLGKPRNIPLYHSDFIFAAISEEFGLIFAIGMLAIYVLIIMRGLIVSFNARTSFHSLAAFGLVIIIGLQTMLIVGGNTKLLPLSGVTLPLVCYGGSSLVSTFFSMGLLLGISSMNAEDEARDIEQLELRQEAM